MFPFFYNIIYNCISTVLYALSELFRQKDSYSEPIQKSKMELFAKIVHSLRRLIIFVKSSILDVGLSSEYASADSNPLSTFSKNEAADVHLFS